MKRNARLLKIAIVLFASFLLTNSAFAQPGTGDHDADGVLDVFDLDDDNDGIPDLVECPRTAIPEIIDPDFENVRVSVIDGTASDVVPTAGIWKGDASVIPAWQSADAGVHAAADWLLRHARPGPGHFGPTSQFDQLVPDDRQLESSWDRSRPGSTAAPAGFPDPVPFSTRLSTTQFSRPSP